MWEIPHIESSDHDYVDEHDPEVDWYAENWMELLEKDMYEALEDYVIIHELSFDKPN